MGKFWTGMGMGVVAGACVGLAVSGMASDSEKKHIRRKAAQTVRNLGDMASDLSDIVRGG